MKRIWLFFLLTLCFSSAVAAQAVVVQGESSPGIYRNVPVDGSNYLYVNCPGCTGAAAPTGANNADAVASVATGLGGGQNFLFGYNGTTWDRLQVDASKYLKVNCTAGCAGGSFNNNADAVATSATNGQSAAWLYGFNGATWDRLQVDASKYLKVAVQNASIAVTNAGTFAVQAAQSGTWNITNVSGTVSLPTGASTAAKQPALGTAGTASTDVISIQGIASMTPIATTLASTTITGTVAATQSGTWTVQPGNTANTTAWKVDGSAVTQPVSGTVSITSNSAVNVAQVGGTAVVADPCQAIAKTNVAISQATSTQIISGTSAKKTYICSIFLQLAATTENVSITAGTGSVCATGASAIIGSTTVASGLVIPASGGFTLGNGAATVASGTVNADNICIIQTGSVRISGVLTYVQQ